MDLTDLQNLSYVTFSTYGNKEYSGTNSSMTNQDIDVLSKVLRLQVYWANYVVHAEGFAAKPLYDRIGISVSPGTPSPPKRKSYV